MNQYVDELLVVARVKGLDVKVEHPKPFRASIEQAVAGLVRSRRTKIFLLGSQCRGPALSAVQRTSGAPELFLIMADDPSHRCTDVAPCSAADNGEWKQSRISETTTHAGTRVHLLAENFHEFHLSRALAIATDRFARTRNLSQVLFLGGADIPVVREWARGLRAGLNDCESELGLVCEYVGRTYSTFDNAWAAYRTASRLIDQHRVDLVIQACGASCKGVLRAAGQRNPSVPVACMDYASWPRRYRGLVFAALTREIPDRIVGERCSRPGCLYLFGEELASLEISGNPCISVREAGATKW